MSPKELLYIEDALGHEQYLQSKCTAVLGQMQDKELKSVIEEQLDCHRRLFRQFYNLV